MRKAIIPALLLLLGLAALVYLHIALNLTVQESNLNHLNHWKPNSSAVHHSLLDLRSVSQKKTQFVIQLTSRFRGHNPPMAVRYSFDPSGHIALFCPARMETWNTDLLALMAWREAKTDLQINPIVDIYHTYIGILPLKVGSLTSMPGNPAKALIHYNLLADTHQLDSSYDSTSISNISNGQQ